ncbi:hypothetical protein [Shewanella xiamenensis]|nr:hypothetical protein [Shewanella xiamenensis]
MNNAFGGVVAIGLMSGAILSTNEYHQQAQITQAREMLSQYATTAHTIFLKDGAWPDSLVTLKAQMPSLPNTQSVGEPVLTIREDGALLFTINTQNNNAATQIASGTNENFSSNGSKVTYTLKPPQGSNLRNVYKQQINAANKNEFSPNKSIDVNSYQITDVADLTVGTLLTNCVFLGSSSVCEGASGELQLTTSLSQLSGSLQASSTINASIVDVINSLKAKSLTANDLISTRTTAGDIVIAAANLTNADVNLLTSTSGAMKSFLADKLNVSGNTKLADLISTKGNLTKITGSDFKVNSKAVFKALEASRLISNNAALDLATISELISTIGEIDNLTANLIDLNKLLANAGVITNLISTTSNIQSATISVGDIKTLNTQTFKGKIADLGASVIKANLSVDVGTIGSVISESSTIATLNSTDMSATSSTGNTLNVANLLKTKDLNVTDQANITGSLVVSELTSAKSLSVSENMSVSNLLTALRWVVNDDLIVDRLLTTKDLTVSLDSVFGDVTVTNGISTQSANVSGKLSTATLNVMNNATIGGLTSVGGTLTTSSLTTGPLSANSLTATNASIGTLNSSNLNASTALTTNNLISSYKAEIYKSVVTNLSSANSSLGMVDGISLVLSGQLQANTATLNSINVTGAGSLGTLEVATTSVIRGSLTSSSDISGASKLSASNVSAPNANISIVNANTVTAVGNIVTGNAITSTGANLVSVNGVYINQDGRILSIEQFKAECINNWTYACAGTLPKLIEISCVGCVQTSNSSGSFTATSISKIIDCPAGCNYSWTIGNGLSKTSCLNGSVSAGQTKSVSCLVSSSPTLNVDQSLSSTVSLSVSHAQRAALNANSDYVVNWNYVGVAPSGSLSCPLCTNKQGGSGAFTATAIATVTNCSVGCTYQWTLGAGTAIDSCTQSGSINSSNQSLACKIKSSPEVATGQTLNSTIGIKVTSNSSASKFWSSSYPIVWFNENSWNLANEAKYACMGTCYNCSKPPTDCSANSQGTTSLDGNASVSIDIVGACRTGETCTYDWTHGFEPSYSTDVPTFKVSGISGNRLSVKLVSSCRNGNWAEAVGWWKVQVKNVTVNQQVTLSGSYHLQNSCKGSSGDL